MSTESWTFFVIATFTIVVCAFMYFESDSYNLKCIISHVDGKTYCVRDRKRLTEAADLLAQVVEKCKKLVDFVSEKYPNDKRIVQLQDRFDPTRISETLPTSTQTAYSENKGEKIAFCLAKKKGENEKLIDLNTLTFVAIHELSHVMTEDTGHNLVFWENFQFLLKCAVECGIYSPVDYKKSPQPYCGMNITDSPLFDL